MLESFARYNRLVSGKKPHITHHTQLHYHDQFLFFSRSVLVAFLFLLVWAPTSPVIPATQNATPPFTLYGFNAYYLVSLLLVPLFVGLGEHLDTFSISRTKLSDQYFRWLFSALSLSGVVAVIVALGQNRIDVLGLAYAGIPITQTILTFAGASVTFPVGVSLSEFAERRLSKFKVASGFGWIVAVLSLLFTETLLQSIVAYPPVGTWFLPLYATLSMFPLKGFGMDLSVYVYAVLLVLSTLLVHWLRVGNYNRMNIPRLIGVAAFSTVISWIIILPSFDIWGFVLGVLLLTGITDKITNQALQKR